MTSLRPLQSVVGLIGLAAGVVLGPQAMAANPGPPPPNDSMAAAVDVSGSEWTATADLDQATRDPWELLPPDQFGHTVWWRWTVPSDGIYEWDTAGSTGPVAIEVGSFDALGQWIPRAASLRRRSGSPATGITVGADPAGSFQAQAGDVLWISADAAFQRQFGLIQFPPQWPVEPGTPYLARLAIRRAAAPPSNDRFADRTLLTGAPVTLRVQLGTAGAEPGEPRLPGESLQRTAWWNWQAPGKGTAQLRRVGTVPAPVVGIYRMGPGLRLERLATSGTEVGNECYREWQGRDVVEWDVTPGERYEIQADRYPWNLPSADSELELRFIPAPTHDALAQAQPLAGTDLRLVVDTAGATRDVEDPVLPGLTGNGSVWFAWTAPGRGVLQVSTNEPLRFSDPTFELLPPGGTWTGGVFTQISPNPCGGELIDLTPPLPFLPAFGIYRRTDNPDGTPRWSLDGYGTNTAVAEVTGETRLQLDGVSDASGQTVMNLLFTPPPPNDRFENRIVLPSAAVKVGGRTFAARSQFGWPISGRAAWWQWTAPESGAWVLRPKTDSPHGQMWLLRGATPNPATTARSTSWPPLLFAATAGEVFQIVAVHTQGFGDNVSFHIEPAIPPHLVLDRRLEVRQGVWTLLDTFEWPSGYDLPRVVESSTDLRHWTVLPSLDDWRFTTPVNEGEPQRFYRTRLPLE